MKTELVCIHCWKGLGITDIRDCKYQCKRCWRADIHKECMDMCRWSLPAYYNSEEEANTKFFNLRME